MVSEETRTAEEAALVTGSHIVNRYDQLLAALQSSQIGVWEWNAITGETSFNDMWYRMLGLEPGELPEHVDSWADLVHPDDKAQTFADLEAYLSGETDTYLNIHRLRHKQGNWVWVRDSGLTTQLTADGKPHILIGTHVDVTALKATEERLISAVAVAEESEQSKNRFLAKLSHELQHSRRLAAIGHLAAGVAHEINNPLAVFRLRLGLLQEQLSEEHKEDLSGLSDHLDRIARIVANLHTFARPSEPDARSVLLSEVLESAREIAGESVESLVFDWELSPPDLAVRADRQHVEQIFVNLYTNATRAMNGRGTVTVQAERVDENVRILVSDDGPGIPVDLLDDIFTPFVTSEKSADGSGLGLAITWGLVQENNGSIGATNRQPHGACFELSLPFSDAYNEATDPVPKPAPPDLPKLGKILCVEDEQGLLEALILTLERLGYAATGVTTAEEASQLITESNFDVVISDLRLPGLSGEALLVELEKEAPRLRKRTILMSGFFEEHLSGELYLQKPFSTEQLVHALGELPANAEL